MNRRILSIGTACLLAAALLHAAAESLRAQAPPASLEEALSPVQPPPQEVPQPQPSAPVPMPASTVPVVPLDPPPAAPPPEANTKQAAPAASLQAAVARIQAPPRRKTRLSLPETHGRVALRYSEDRWDGHRAQKMSEYLRLNSQRILSEKLSAELDVRDDLAAEDQGLSTRRGNRTRLFSANLLLERLPLGTSFRLGRQFYYASNAAVNFDGAAMEWAPSRWVSAGAFAGDPVVYMGAGLADRFQGGFFKLGGGQKAHLRADLIQAVHDTGFRTDRDLQLAYFQRLGRTLTTNASASMLNGRGKSLSFRLQYSQPKSGLVLAPFYFKQLYVVDYANELVSPYVTSVAHYERFERAGLRASRTFLAKYSVSATGEAYWPTQRQRFSMNFSAFDLLLPGLTASVSGSQDLSKTSSNFSMSFSAGFKMSKSVEMSAGTGYYSNENMGYYERTRDETRVYYTELKWRRSKNMDVSVSPSMTDNSAMGYKTTRVEFRNNWRF